MSVTSDTIAAECRGIRARSARAATRGWTSAYRRRSAGADCASALAAGMLASAIRFAHEPSMPAEYLAWTCLLPVLWWASVVLAGGYNLRFIGLGSDEFRRIINA